MYAPEIDVVTIHRAANTSGTSVAKLEPSHKPGHVYFRLKSSNGKWACWHKHFKFYQDFFRKHNGTEIQTKMNDKAKIPPYTKDNFYERYLRTGDTINSFTGKPERLSCNCEKQ